MSRNIKGRSAFAKNTHQGHSGFCTAGLGPGARGTWVPPLGPAQPSSQTCIPPPASASHTTCFVKQGKPQDRSCLLLLQKLPDVSYKWSKIEKTQPALELVSDLPPEGGGGRVHFPLPLPAEAASAVLGAPSLPATFAGDLRSCSGKSRAE